MSILASDMHLCPHAYHAWDGQKRALEPLELESQTALSTMWVLRTEFQCSGKTPRALNS